MSKLPASNQALFFLILSIIIISTNAYAEPQKCLLKDEKAALDSFMSDWRNYVFTQFLPEIRNPIFDAYKELAKLPMCETMKDFVKMPNLVDTYTGSMAARAPDLVAMEEMYKTEGFSKTLSNNLFKNYVLPFPKNILIPTATYSNKEYGFSIEYPMGWVINDTKSDNPTDPIVGFNYSFISDQEYSDAYLSVYLNTTSSRLQLQGKAYLDDMINEEKSWCNSITLKKDEYLCTNFISKGTKQMEINNLKAYQSEYSYIERDDYGTYLIISSETEIPIQDKIWGIYTESADYMYPNTIHQFRTAIQSFRLEAISQPPAIEMENKLEIPLWIKNNAKWWSEGSINDADFTKGIQFLIKENIMKIPKTEISSTKMDQKIPNWIKNNADWWAHDKISDNDFVSGIQYLISNGMIKIGQSH